MKIENIFGSYASGDELFRKFYVLDNGELKPVWRCDRGECPNYSLRKVKPGCWNIARLQLEGSQMQISPQCVATPLNVSLMQGAYREETLLQFIDRFKPGHNKVRLGPDDRWGGNFGLVLDLNKLQPLGKLQLQWREYHNANDEDAITFLTAERCYPLGENILFWTSFAGAYSQFTDLTQRFRAFKRSYGSVSSTYSWLIKNILQDYDIIPRQCARSGY